MINIVDKSKCCGCTACKTVCPKECITLIEDKEGFSYPQIDKEKCIKCNLCESVCQYISQKEVKKFYDKPLCYAAIELDFKEILESSSGGAFYVFAKAVIEMGGSVFGAIYDSNMVVKHIRATSINEIKKMRKSKYVQSDLGNIYSEVKQTLNKEKIVLFTGTPCQIGGLYHYLGQDYSNLITMDILCFSVPSPKVFSEYIKETEKEYKSKIVNIDFRDKSRGWLNASTKIEFEDKNIEYLRLSSENGYYLTFLSHYFTRPACNNCLYTNINRKSDITIGDYWGIENFNNNIDNKYGVSKILVNSDKGKIFVERYLQQFEYYELPLETAIRINLLKPAKVRKNKEKFVRYFDEKGYKFVEKKIIREYKFNKIKYIISKKIRGK